MLTQFSRNFVWKNKYIEDSLCMKLVKRENIFSKARGSFILCNDGTAHKIPVLLISVPETAQHRGYTVVYMLKVISILWDSSKRN